MRNTIVMRGIAHNHLLRAVDCRVSSGESDLVYLSQANATVTRDNKKIEPFATYTCEGEEPLNGYKRTDLGFGMHDVRITIQEGATSFVIQQRSGVTWDATLEGIPALVMENWDGLAADLVHAQAESEQMAATRQAA